MDVYNWFDTHSGTILFAHPIKTKLVTAILRHFFDFRNRFSMEKETYEMDIFIPKDKKKQIQIKPSLSEGQSKKIHEGAMKMLEAERGEYYKNG